jgi:hypothetical protein
MHAGRFLFAVNGDPRISGALGTMKKTVHTIRLEHLLGKLVLLNARFLQAHDIGILLFEPRVKAFAVGGTNAIHV